MKKVLTLILLAFGFIISPIKAQDVALKSNLIYDATTTMNLGMEIGLSKKWTLDVPFNFNPWKFDNGSRLRHWAVQPEIRYWFCERFNRSFVGLHGHYADFNVGGLPDLFFVSDNMQTARYQGHLYGGGVSFGYSWILSNRWSIEASMGLGYTRIVYDKYPCAECGSQLLDDAVKNFIGPTKASLSLIYIIK